MKSMDLMEEFIAQMDHKKSEPNVRSQLSAFVRDIGDVCDVTPVELKGYFKDLAQMGKYKPATINLRISLARGMYSWLVSKKLVSEDMMILVKNVHDPDKRRVKRITIDEVEYTLLAARENKRDYAMLLFFLATACRVSEICRVRLWEFKRAINSGVLMLHGKGRGSGKDEAVAFNNPKTIKAIKKYLKERQDDSDYLFVTHLGNKMGSRSIQQIVKKYMLLANAKYHKQCQIEEGLMHPHTLRHTAIDEFWKNSREPVATKDFGRHGSFTTTLIYINQTDFKQQGSVVNKAGWN